MGSLVNVQSDLAPTIVIPLDASPGGGMTETGLRFAGENTALFVLEPVWNATWGKWLGWHLPTIAATALVLVVVAGWWWGRRVWKRPRQAGRMYCRVCNHQLAKPQLKLNEKKRAVWADSESKCPECGVRHKRGPARGRSFVVRMLACGLIVPPLVLVACLTLVTTVAFYTPPAAGAGWGSGTWPVEGLERVFGSWALERRWPAVLVQSSRLRRVDPKSGASEDLGLIDTWGLGHSDFVTEDGAWVVVPGETRTRMLVIDTRDGSRREFGLSESKGRTVHVSVKRFLADGTTALLERWSEEGGVQWNELVKFDPRDGKSEAIGRVKRRPDPTMSGVYANSEFEVVERDGRVAWVHAAWTRSYSGRDEEVVLRWEQDGKLKERIEKTASGALHCELDEGGKYVIVRDRMAGTKKTIDLTSGEDSDVDVTVGWGGDRRKGPRLAWAGVGIAEVLSMNPARGRIATIRTSSKQFALSGSADGRFVAAAGDRDVPPGVLARLLGAPAKVGHEVRIWDLDLLIDRETEKVK